MYGYNSDFSDHDENLRAVLQRARDTGLRFKLDKYKFRYTRIPFFGHILGAEGLQPDPRKIDSILSMDPSTSLADLQTFLGMVQILSSFIPNLASLAASLWGLTRKTTDFVWIPDTDRIKKAGDVGCSIWFGEVPLLRLRPARCCGIRPQTAGGYF